MRAQCCICSDLFENKSVNIAALPCGHTFHEDCLMRWMETSSTCPSCRSNVKRNQIIKRLFFDIQEDNCGDEDVGQLLNQISNLKAQISDKDKQKQEIAECRDYYSTRFAAAEAGRLELQMKLHEEQNLRDVLQRDLRLLRQENSAYVEEMKAYRKAEKRLQELQNVETLLKGCDSDIQDIVGQYSEASESSVKQLASLLTVLKREYNQVLADKKALREHISKMKRSVGHYHSEAHKSKREMKELKTDLEKTQEALSQVERENNENRRKLVHLRNALRHNKTEGSQSFHRALNEDSPNVAYTPPKFRDTARDLNDDEENGGQNLCLSPDLFEESPKLNRNCQKRKCLEELHGPKLKFANVQTAAERFKSGKHSSSEILADEPPKIPQSMLSIMRKKLTGQSNSRAHVPSVITRGYDGFGGSETFVHTQGQSNFPLKLDSKKGVGKQNNQMSSKLLSSLFAKQPHISSFVHSLLPSSPSSSLSSVEEVEDSGELKSKQAQTDKPRKKDKVYGAGKLPSFLTMKTTASSSSSSLKNAPKLSPDEIIDLT